ncbi:MAG TPA: hypothetical protein VLZ05_06100 [Mycobacterium sp.]|nr:hypothetical protein [Mycobacterium sp.]HUH68478.1 hypothetical protein [Mycobacterium sp.]
MAQTLTLSVRTIEGHIYRACAGAGAATRTELAQLITQFASAHNSPVTTDGHHRLPPLTAAINESPGTESL